MDVQSLTFEYATHPPVRDLVHTITETLKSVSLGFDHWETPHVEGPGLYIVVVSGSSVDEYAEPMGTNRWPVDECRVVGDESFFDAARTVARDCDGAVVVTVDGTVHEQMVRLTDRHGTEGDTDDRADAVTYADWMGARHMSALETSLRDEVVTTITLSGETGRVTRFEDGEYATELREEFASEWREED